MWICRDGASQKMTSDTLPQASCSALIHHLASGLDKPQEQCEPPARWWLVSASTLLRFFGISSTPIMPTGCSGT